MDKVVSVEPFPPGEFIQDELNARDWTQDDLAEVMGRTRQHVSRLIKGQTAIGPDSARELAEAFGTSPEMWMNLQTSYELSKSACEDRQIKRKADLYTKVPVREMRKRCWIGEQSDVGQMDAEILRFMRMSSWDAKPAISIAARKATDYGSHSFAQLAWGSRAMQLGSCVMASRYRDENIDGGLAELRKLAANPEDIRRVPAVLSSMGVRLVVIQHLQGTKIDGAAVWLDRDSPVIALSLRYGRIDNFWHNLFHEMIHVKYRDTPVIDVELNGESADEDGGEIEARANREAANALVPSEKLESFIARHTPLFYQAKVVQFANARGVHPGIVVGQLHHRKALDYRHLTKLLVDVRQYISGAALTDGWGDCPIV